MNASNLFKGGSQSPLTNGGEGRKMSALRVFLIVVVLHVVVLGPILIFEGCKGTSSQEPQMTENTDPSALPMVDAQMPPLPQQVTDPSLIAAAQPAPSSVPVAGQMTAPIAAPAPAASALAPATVPTAAVPQTLKTVKVQSGDSLWKIAKNEKVPLAELMRVNNLSDKSVLRIGQEIKIPAAMPPPRTETTVAATAPTTSAVTGTTYTVQPGDSLWAIAKKYNTTVAALREANNITGSNLKVNQKIVIPASAPQTSTAVPVATVDPITGGTVRSGETTYHVVGVGEVLSSIAHKYGVTVQEIMTANQISDPRQLRANQRLIIPLKQSAPIPQATPMPQGPPPATPSGTAPERTPVG